MAGSLRGVNAKLDRARAHLADLDRADETVNGICNDAIAHRRDPPTGHYVFTIEVVPAPPPDFATIVGDAIHNVRAALDYLAWQLVVARPTRGVPNENTTFPIYTVPPTANRYGRTRPQIAPGVADEVREALDSVQPYKASPPGNHDLAVLHALDICDKHRALLISVIGIKDAVWWGNYQIASFNFGPYKDGDEVCRLMPDNPDDDAEPDPNLNFAVRLDEPDAGPWGQMLSAASVLRRSLDYVEQNVIPRFRKYF